MSVFETPPWSNVDLSSQVSCGIHNKAIYIEILMILIYKMSFKMTFSKLKQQLPEANEFTTVIHNTLIYWYTVIYEHIVAG